MKRALPPTVYRIYSRISPLKKLDQNIYMGRDKMTPKAANFVLVMKTVHSNSS